MQRKPCQKSISGCSSVMRVSGVKNTESKTIHSNFSEGKVMGSSPPSNGVGTQAKIVNNIKSPVRTRVFTSSSFNSKSVNSMLAKGNKVRILNSMVTLHQLHKGNHGEFTGTKKVAPMKLLILKMWGSMKTPNRLALVPHR